MWLAIIILSDIRGYTTMIPVVMIIIISFMRCFTTLLSTVVTPKRTKLYIQVVQTLLSNCYAVIVITGNSPIELFPSSPASRTFCQPAKFTHCSQFIHFRIPSWHTSTSYSCHNKKQLQREQSSRAEETKRWHEAIAPRPRWALELEAQIWRQLF